METVSPKSHPLQLTGEENDPPLTPSERAEETAVRRKSRPVLTSPTTRLRRVPLEELSRPAPHSRVPSVYATSLKEAEDGAFVSAITVHPRYRHVPSHSQGSLSLRNGSVGSHSRMSSREVFSWDSITWKDAGAELCFPLDPSRDYLRLGCASTESVFSANDADARPRRHVRSLAAWDRAEVEALERGAARVPPIGRTDANSESAYDTVPIGHQPSFSLASHKEPAAATRPDEPEAAKGPTMTHVMVSFKHLYGVFYVPRSEWGTFHVGDLVTVESHAGENTGRVVCDLTAEMATPSAKLAALARDVLCPEDPSQPLETTDPHTGKETLLRLPRVIRRGMNKGKKRLYYARRRETEAFSTCQRIIREQGLCLAVSSVEYQVDFKRITVFCAGSSASASRQELVSFTQQLASHLRGSTVVMLFSAESPEVLEVTRGITDGAFHALYAEAMAQMPESETAQTRATPPPMPPAHMNPRGPRVFTETSVNHMGPPAPIAIYGPPAVAARPPLMMAPPGVGPIYGLPGMPHIAWGTVPVMATPPPYLGPPHVVPGMGGRM